MTLWEELFIVLIVLKLPVFYVGWVLWWAIKAEPELGTEGGTEGVNWRPWRRPTPSRPTPSGSPVRPHHGAPGRARDRAAARDSRRSARLGEGRL